VYNGLEDTDGCPDMGKVVIQQSNIVIQQPVFYVPTPVAAPPPAKDMKEEKKFKAGAKKGKAKYDYDFADDSIEGELLMPEASYAAAAYDAEPGLAPDDDRKAGPKQKVAITIRTNFAETSLWAPHLESKGGKVEFYSTLPDSITTQTVTLMASDDKGAVGLLREKVEVGQDLYVRSSLPAVLTVGDSVEVFAVVRNFTKKKTSAKVSLSSESVKVVGTEEKKVSVPAGGAAVVSFVVKPDKAGMAGYEVRAEGPDFVDAERRELFIRPLGISDRITAKGMVKKGKPFKANVKVSGNDMYLFSFMNVSFPTAVPVIQGLEEILSQPGGAIDFVSSKALTAAMVYQYLQKYGKNEQAIEDLQPFLQQLMAALLMTQNADGGWGWHFLLRNVSVDGKEDIIPITSNPYMTAQSLEGLVEMKRAGLPVPEDAVQRAMGALTGSVGGDGLWSVDAIAFWEGDTRQVQTGVSAEIFRVMADTCEVYPNMLYTFKGPMDQLANTFEPMLDMDEMRDPMALSNAATAVYTWGKLSGRLNKDLEKKLKAAAKKLIKLREEAYWEPSWFNAFGGTIEATVAAMAFMYRLDRDGYEAELRRSVQYILSTQESFGAWHNARGTAAAIRGLLLMPPTEKEIPSTVSVLVNGELAARVDIDPEDPYLSAVNLRQVEITKYLKTGDNKVEVHYDGNLKAPVTLHLEKWSEKKAFSAVRQKNAPDVKVYRTYAGEGKKEGAPVDVTLEVEVKDLSGPLIVKEPLPSNAQVESASLDRLMDEGKVSGYELESNAVVFYLAPDKEGTISFSYRLETLRRGTCMQPGTLVSTTFDPDAYVSGKPTKLTVM
jgi:hypothetical protein